MLERSLRYAISHQKAVHDLACSEERYALAVRAANDGIWDWDLDADRMYFSPRWHAILGQPEHTHSEDPDSWFGLVHPGDRAAPGERDRPSPRVAAHRTCSPSTGSVTPTAAGAGSRLAGWRSATPRAGPTRMAGSLSDITDRRVAQLRLQHDALHDTLTGLPNRTLLLDRLGQILQRDDRDARAGCAVLFMDIDRFKLVNDSLSHAVGDNLLIALSGRLAAALRPGDTVARLGGDEFTVLLEDVAGVEDALVVAQRVLGVARRSRSRSTATSCSSPPASGSRSAHRGLGAR